MKTTPWQHLLLRVREDVPNLLDDFLRELKSQEGYTGGVVADEDLERTALGAFELFLVRLESPLSQGSNPEFPEALGRRRARQGVRIDQFTEAVRINFRLLWRALNRAAQPDLVDELVANGERVLNVVERYATEVQRAFLDETQRMAALRRSARERAVSMLFSGRKSVDELSESAEVLRLRAGDTFEMLAISASLAETDALRAKTAEFGTYMYEDAGMSFIFRPRQHGSSWADVHTHVDGVYLSRIFGVGNIGAAARIARRLDAVRFGSGIFTLKDGLHLLAYQRLLPEISGFQHELLGDFEKLDDADRARLVTTVQTFLRTGSMQDTANELFLHRNTVFKRLRHLEEITGLDITVPRDAAIALIFLSEMNAVSKRTPGNSIQLHDDTDLH